MFHVYLQNKLSDRCHNRNIKISYIVDDLISQKVRIKANNWVLVYLLSVFKTRNMERILTLKPYFNMICKKVRAIICVEMVLKQR